MKTYHLRVTGKVQGVWFRASTKDKARALRLKGKVWNEPDGSVSIIVQGPDDMISAFIEWCNEGPMLAEVNDVIVTEQMRTEIFSDFEITRK